MMYVNVTDRLADFIVNMEYGQFPRDVTNAGKEAFLDFLAVSIAGYRKGPLSKLLIDYLMKIGGKPESTVIGVGKRIPSINAALANGVNGQSMDLDDCHRKAIGGVGVSVIPAALAAGELIGCSGKTLLTAIIAGYEILVRIGKAVNPSLQRSRGFHATGVCGALAAAGTAAKVFSLDKDKLVSALGIAGTQSAGLSIVAHSGQMIKPLNAGKAAQSGVISALLSKAGASGPLRILEGEDGFVQAFSDSCDYSFITDNLGASFGINECYKKYYPCCRHTHASIDAALHLKNAKNFIPEDIQEIRVTTYPAGLRHSQKEKMPEDEAGSRFNLAFAVSLALVKGRAGIDEFSTESISNQKIKNLFDKVKILGDPYFESEENNIRGAEVEIILEDNNSYKKRVLLPKGEPENPLTKKELHDKYHSCIGNFWAMDKKEEILKHIQQLEHVDNIRKLTRLLRHNSNKTY